MAQPPVYPGTPTWVKAIGVVAAVVILLVVLLVVVGGHGPVQH